MKLDIARQPLVPAFLTLFACTVLAMCFAQRLVPSDAASAERTSAERTSGERVSAQTAQPTDPNLPAAAPTASAAHPTDLILPAAAPSAAQPTDLILPAAAPTASAAQPTDPTLPAAAPSAASAAPTASAAQPTDPNLPAAAPSAAHPTDLILPAAAPTASAAPSAAAELLVPLPRTLLIAFQNSCPISSRMLAGFLILFAGLCVGRLTVRYNLYSVGTCVAIPLYALTACPFAAMGAYLPACTASVVLALAMKHFGRSFCNGYAFDAIFRASLLLGALPLVSPAALPLLLLLPLGLLLFRRTAREVVVAAAGVLLPGLAMCYVNWGAGGAFAAPLIAVVDPWFTGEPLALLPALALPTAILLCAIAALNLLAALFFLSDLYAAGTKPRFILLFAICAWVLSLLLLGGGAATLGDAALLAVPSAMLLPVLLVRIHRMLALSLYLLVMAGALAAILLQ